MVQRKKDWAIFTRYFIYIIILLAIISGFVYYITRPLSPTLIANHKRITAIEEEVKNLRKTFGYEQNAITYAISHGIKNSKEIYKQSEAKAMQSFTKLKSLIKDKKINIYLDNLIYNQTIFSEQVARLYSTLASKKKVTLTYDEQTDLKAYGLSTLNQAKKYTDNFDTLLGKIDEFTAKQEMSYNAVIESIIKQFKLYGSMLLGILILLTLIITPFFAIEKEDELQKLSALIKKTTENNFEDTVPFTNSKNPAFVNIVQNFNTLIMHYLNQKENLKTSAQKTAEKIKNLENTLAELTEEEQKNIAINKENIKNVLEYIQNFENINFFIKQIELTFESIQNANNDITKNQNKMAETLKKSTEENKKIHESLIAFNKVAEKINLLALNINIESTKLGDETKGFGMISNEIRKLISDFLEMSRSFTTIIRNNTESLNKSIQTFNSTQDLVKAIKEQFNNTKNNINSIHETIQKEISIEKGIENSQETAIETSHLVEEKILQIKKDFEDLNSEISHLLSKNFYSEEEVKTDSNYYESKELDEIAEKSIFNEE